MITRNQPAMLHQVVRNGSPTQNLVVMKNKKFLFLLATCLMLTQAFCQPPTSLIGVWENTTDNVTLELRNDFTGRYVQGSKTFVFQEPYSIHQTGTEWNLQFQITANGSSRTIYARVKELSSTHIKFIAFLTKEELESADDEIKNSGITLTKTE
jgi:hypothetical protein